MEPPGDTAPASRERPSEARPDGGFDPRAPFRSLLRLLAKSFSQKHAQCLDARFLSAEVSVDRAAAKRLLPFGMWLAKPARATLFIVDYRHPTFTGPYREAAILIHVRTLFGAGVHCCWMVLDPDDSAMIYGRELLAFPKKMARIDWEERQDGSIRAEVTRHGQALVAIEGRRGGQMKQPQPLLDTRFFNIGGIGQLLALNFIWCFRIGERIRTAQEFELGVTVSPSRDDPIPIPAGTFDLSGQFASADIFGLRYLIPAGLAGPWWFARSYFIRFR